MNKNIKGALSSVSKKKYNNYGQQLHALPLVRRYTSKMLGGRCSEGVAISVCRRSPLSQADRMDLVRLTQSMRLPYLLHPYPSIGINSGDYPCGGISASQVNSATHSLPRAAFQQRCITYAHCSYALNVLLKCTTKQLLSHSLAYSVSRFLKKSTSKLLEGQSKPQLRHSGRNL